MTSRDVTSSVTWSVRQLSTDIRHQSYRTVSYLQIACPPRAFDRNRLETATVEMRSPGGSTVETARLISAAYRGSPFSNRLTDDCISNGSCPQTTDGGRSFPTAKSLRKTSPHAEDNDDVGRRQKLGPPSRARVEVRVGRTPPFRSRIYLVALTTDGREDGQCRHHG